MADEKLRIYKHGSGSYAEVTSATEGGFDSLTLTHVRNEAGSLEFNLAATAAPIVNGWMNEAAKVEWWRDGAKREIFYVDDYNLKWSALSAAVKCVGVLISGKTALFTGAASGVPAGTFLQTLCAAVTDWVWDGSKVDAGSYTIAALDYVDKPADEALKEVCQLGGLTFWFDADKKLNVEVLHTSTDHTYAMGTTGHEFDTTYTARDIINVLTIVGASATYGPFTDTTSWTDYGPKALKISLDWVNSSQQAQDYADAFFLENAQPRRILGLSVNHDVDLRPGLKVAVTGLGDGRTYEDIIQQVAYKLGELWDDLQIGPPPLALTASQASVTTVSSGGTPGPQGPTGPPGADATLPDFPTYWATGDTVGNPQPPTEVVANLAHKTLIVGWKMPSEYQFRTWELYQDITWPFTPDTANGTNRIYTGQQTVTIVKHNPSATAYYYKVCAVNTRGERSTFVDITNGGAGFVFTAIPAGEIDTITTGQIVAGGATIAEALIGNLSASKITAGTIDAARITGITVSALTITAATINGGTVTGATLRTAAPGASSGAIVLGSPWDRIVFYAPSIATECGHIVANAAGGGYPAGVAIRASDSATGLFVGGTGSFFAGNLYCNSAIEATGDVIADSALYAKGGRLHLYSGASERQIGVTGTSLLLTDGSNNTLGTMPNLADWITTLSTGYGTTVLHPSGCVGVAADSGYLYSVDSAGNLCSHQVDSLWCAHYLFAGTSGGPSGARYYFGGSSYNTYLRWDDSAKKLKVYNAGTTYTIGP